MIGMKILFMLSPFIMYLVDCSTVRFFHRGPGVQAGAGMRGLDRHPPDADKLVGEQVPGLVTLQLHRHGRGRQDNRHGI